ncbi:uncharacterized protein V6R79_002247 [Siganus canaliculatus]
MGSLILTSWTENALQIDRSFTEKRCSIDWNNRFRLKRKANSHTEKRNWMYAALAVR